MLYNKRVTYENTHLKNLQKTGKVIDEDVVALAELLENNGEKEVYEVGFDFGQRLAYFQECGFKVDGGIEFSKEFAMYQGEYIDPAWNLTYVDAQDYWLPELWNKSKKCCVVYKCLENCSEAQRLLHILKLHFDSIYIISDLKLDLPKVNNVYIFNNESGNDIKESASTKQDSQRVSSTKKGRSGSKDSGGSSRGTSERES